MRRFEGYVLLYLGLVLVALGGFAAGWMVRGEREAGAVEAMRAAKESAERDAAAKGAEAASCAATVEQSFKQSREVAAKAAQCREALAHAYNARNP